MPTASPNLAGTTVVQTTDQHVTNLHSNVGNALGAMGQPAVTVPESERPVFTGTDAAELVQNAVVNGLTDPFSESTLETGTRASPGRHFGRWVLDRMRRLKGSKK